MPEKNPSKLEIFRSENVNKWQWAGLSKCSVALLRAKSDRSERSDRRKRTRNILIRLVWAVKKNGKFLLRSIWSVKKNATNIINLCPQRDMTSARKAARASRRSPCTWCATISCTATSHGVTCRLELVGHELACSRRRNTTVQIQCAIVVGSSDMACILLPLTCQLIITR